MATLDGNLAKAETLGKNILIDPQGGWVSGGWFSANGNISYANGVQTCDFNNAAGLVSAQGMWNAYSTGHIIRSEPAIVSQFLDGNIFAGISGTWNAAAMEEVLGANYGAIKLPTFTNGLDVQQQLGTMVGAKLLGVNGFTDEPMAAHAFSEWLTNSDNQIARCEAVGNGPSNIVALESEAVTSNIALSALASQAPFGILQAKSVGSQYWTPAGAFADYLITNSTLADPTERAAAYDLLQDQLDAMVAQIIATS
jgi:arabinogalactan oligomer/maltooligosaccharide transport system substrate-binding protein